MNPQIKLSKSSMEYTKNGDNDSENSGTKEMPVFERIAYASGIQQPSMELVERFEAILDTYAARLEERIDLNAKKAIELLEQGTRPGLELGEPYSGPVYKWQDLFVVGPIQNISTPPYLPHKIVAAGEAAFFFVFVVKNPLPTPGPGPSALTIMNGRPFNLNAVTINLTNMSNGPDIFISSRFNRSVVQPFMFVFNAPVPQQGKPSLFEINVTLDVTDGFLQPIAGFATSIFDIESDPGFPVGPANNQHLHVEQPLRFLVYKP